MNILKLLFSILNSIDTDSLAVKQVNALSQVAVAIINGQSGPDIRNKIFKLAESLIEETPRKREHAPKYNSRLRAGYNSRQKDWETRQRAEEKARLKELEQMAEADIRQVLAEARTYLLALKQVFAVLESNFYDRLAVYTPVDTGNLLSSLYTRHIGLFSIQIGFDTHKAPYAIYVHECDYKHPNGGISQFLMVAFTEAWMYTRVALNDYLNTNSTLDDDIKKVMDMQLDGMNYTIDISKNKLAITISMLHNYRELNNMHLDELADGLEGSDAKEILEQQLKEYSQYVFNLSNTTKIPNAKLRGLSPKAKKKFTLFSLYKRLDENGVSSQTARKRAERMENAAKSLYKTTEIYEQAASIKLNSKEQQVVAEMLNTNTDLSLAIRLSARERMNKKIIYPLILDQIDKQQRAVERQKAIDERNRQVLIEMGYIDEFGSVDDFMDEYFDDEDDIEITDDDFAVYESDIQILQPDQPADIEGEQTT